MERWSTDRRCQHRQGVRGGSGRRRRRLRGALPQRSLGRSARPREGSHDVRALHAADRRQVAQVKPWLPKGRRLPPKPVNTCRSPYTDMCLNACHKHVWYVPKPYGPNHGRHTAWSKSSTPPQLGLRLGGFTVQETKVARRLSGRHTPGFRV